VDDDHADVTFSSPTTTATGNNSNNNDSTTITIPCGTLTLYNQRSSPNNFVETNGTRHWRHVNICQILGNFLQECTRDQQGRAATTSLLEDQHGSLDVWLSFVHGVLALGSDIVTAIVVVILLIECQSILIHALFILHSVSKPFKRAIVRRPLQTTGKLVRQGESGGWYLNGSLPLPPRIKRNFSRRF
jgi:hypothetical protein